jgi:RNA polymerase sigma-70 factor (ECF subfamily)
MFCPIASQTGIGVLQVNDKTALVELVRRIIARDPRAEEEMALRYRAGIFQIIYRVVQNYSVAEDLSQETLMKALEKTRQGDVREPERFSGFICQMAKFIALDYVRKLQLAVKNEEVDTAEQVCDPSPDPYQQVLEKENAEVVRKVLREMKVPRDREVLFRFYILEEEKDDICAAMQLTREQFSRIIFRALRRYKELHLKITGKS